MLKSFLQGRFLDSIVEIYKRLKEMSQIFSEIQNMEIMFRQGRKRIKKQQSPKEHFQTIL